MGLNPQFFMAIGVVYTVILILAYCSAYLANF